MPSIQIFLYVLSLALVLAWILNTEKVEFKKIVDNYDSQCDHVYISSGEETTWYSILALSVIGFWTIFWNLLLLKFLQVSRRIERSAVFLFQQSILLHLIVHGFGLATSIYLWVTHAQYLDNLYYETTRPFEVALFIQNLFFCMYIGLRFYLTYHRNGTIRVVFGYKMFLFLLTLTIPSAICYISDDNSNYISLGGFIILEILKLFLMAGIFKRRHRFNEDKVKQHATWIWAIIVDSYTIVWLTFNAEVNELHDECLKNYNLFQRNYSPNTKLIFSFILLGPSLAAFAVIITDDNLRKSYLEDFDLTKCCGGGSDRSGTQQNEDDPLLGNSNQPHYGDEANAQRTGNGDDEHNAHESRTTEDKVRCMPHQDNSDDVKYAAHAQQTRNNEDEIHCMPHQDNSDDVKYGAHKVPNKDEDDVLYGAAQSPSGPYQIIGRTQHQISNQTTQHKDKELLDIAA